MIGFPMIVFGCSSIPVLEERLLIYLIDNILLLVRSILKYLTILEKKTESISNIIITIQINFKRP